MYDISRRKNKRVKDGLRKFLAVLLSVMIVFAFAACGGNNEPDEDQAEDSVFEKLTR